MREVVVSDEFLSSLDALPSELKNRTLAKVRLLAENPAHPSLNAHKLNRAEGKWECYVTDAYRLIYEPSGGEIRLWRVGDHSIVDRAHILSFSPHTSFRRLDEEEPQVTEQKPFEIPAAWSQPRQEENNQLALLPSAHLRILGVPSHLIRAFRTAPSLEDATTIPGIPEHSRQWLLDLATNPDLESVLFNPSQLLFRTTLDKLEGYCKGQIKRLMLNLEPEQKLHVERNIDGAMLVRGCAGSGKTTIALYRAIRCAETGGRTIFFTFNRILAAAAKSLIKELIGPLPPNLEVVNIDAWIVQFLRQRGHTASIVSNADQRAAFLSAVEEVQHQQRSYVLEFPWTFFRDEIGRVIKGCGLQREEDYLAIARYGRKTALKRKARSATWAVYTAYERELKKRGCMDWQDVSLMAYKELFVTPLAEPYNHVIIDEAQDLTALQVRIAQRMTKGGAAQTTRSLFLVGDVAQTLYSRGFSWKQAGLQLQGRSASIRRNFRNTRQIAQTAAALNSYNRHIRLAEDYVDPQFTKRQGSWPIVLQCDIAERETRAVSEKIMELAGDNHFRLSDFAVLCPTVGLSNDFKNQFDRLEIPSITKGDEQFDLLEERVKVLTIHSAKGLEFPVVFLTGLHNGIFPQTRKAVDDEEADLAVERDRTLMYVGMTRAAEALYLVTSEDEPSQFVAEISKLLRTEKYTGGKK